MASPRVERILRQVSDTAANLMDLDSFYVALLDETMGQLVFPFAVSNGDELETGKGKWVSRPYKGQAALPDYVMEIGHPVLTEPDLKSWMAENKVGYWADEVPLSWLGVPMAVGTKVLGVLVAENYGKARAFDSGTRTVLSSMASQAATAIANARLYERLDRLNEVGQRLTSGIRLRRDAILELIYEQASQLMDTRNMYIALYDEETDMVSFGLAMQDGRRVDVEREKGWAPRKAGKGKTEEIIRTQKPILHGTKREAEQWYAAEHEEYIGRIASSWLGVPMIVSEKVLGVIATYNWERENAYDKDDLEVLQTMANQAAIAMDNAVLYYDINQNLERRLKDLQVLNEVGQRLTSGIRLRRDEILELIYKQASQLMDTRNMYIALYDEETDIVSFGLAMQDGKRVDVEKEKGWAPRKAGKGATEEVIHTKEPLLLRTRKETGDWYAKHIEYIGLVPNAWLGVPMMIEDKVIGVIALLNNEADNVYSEDDQEVLQTMAGQAAIAIENARLYEQLRTEYIAQKQLATLGTATAALQHRISNTLNLVNPGIMRLRSRIDPNDENAAKILDIMERNVGYTSQIINRLQEPLKEEDATVTDVNSRLKEIVQDVREKQPEMCQKVTFNLDGLRPGIPRIEIGTGQLTEVLRNLVENACKAMQPQGGTLNISSRLVDRTIEVEFQDTGPGIPPNILDRLFTKPVPPKDFGAGTGLGLWLSKLILQKYGGDIEVKETSEGEGTTMLIRLPTIQQPTTQQAESEDVP